MRRLMALVLGLALAGCAAETEPPIGNVGDAVGYEILLETDGVRFVLDRRTGMVTSIDLTSETTTSALVVDQRPPPTPLRAEASPR